MGGTYCDRCAQCVVRDLGDVFDQRADNTLLIKASYWINR